MVPIWIQEPRVAARVAVAAAAVVVTLLTDGRTGRIPDGVSLGVLAAALLVAGPEPPAKTAAAALIGAGLPAIARTVTGGALGWGDVKLSTGLAVLVGPAAALTAMLIASFLGLALLAAGGGATVRDGLPFGPCLAAGALISALHAGAWA